MSSIGLKEWYISYSKEGLVEHNTHEEKMVDIAYR